MMSKRYYDDFDCYIDPEKLYKARMRSTLKQVDVTQKLPCLDKTTISRLEKGSEKRCMNFGVAKELAKLLGTHYSKFVVLAPNQLSKLTKRCRGLNAVQLNTASGNVVTLASAVQSAEPVEKKIPNTNVSFSATPSAVIFKDSEGREFKYVLADTNIA